MTANAKLMAEALWKTMRERDMSMEEALDVCAAVMVGVGKHAPASNEELLGRIEQKIYCLHPDVDILPEQNTKKP